jgi:hypothetical protein
MLLDERITPHRKEYQRTIELVAATVEIASGRVVLSAALFSPSDSVPNRKQWR